MTSKKKSKINPNRPTPFGPSARAPNSNDNTLGH